MPAARTSGTARAGWSMRSIRAHRAWTTGPCAVTSITTAPDRLPPSNRPRATRDGSGHPRRAELRNQLARETQALHDLLMPEGTDLVEGHQSVDAERLVALHPPAYLLLRADDQRLLLAQHLPDLLVRHGLVRHHPAEQPLGSGLRGVRILLSQVLARQPSAGGILRQRLELGGRLDELILRLEKGEGAARVPGRGPRRAVLHGLLLAVRAVHEGEEGHLVVHELAHRLAPGA